MNVCESFCYNKGLPPKKRAKMTSVDSAMEDTPAIDESNEIKRVRIPIFYIFLCCFVILVAILYKI